jgi:hypothetical protein
MPNLLQAAITIEGTRPLIWNHVRPEAIPLTKQEKRGVAGNDPDEWRKAVLFVPESRQLYTLPIAIFSCIRKGAKFTKKGRASLMADMGATLQVFDDRVLVDRYLPAEQVLLRGLAARNLSLVNGLRGTVTEGVQHLSMFDSRVCSVLYSRRCTIYVVSVAQWQST